MGEFALAILLDNASNEENDDAGAPEDESVVVGPPRGMLVLLVVLICVLHIHPKRSKRSQQRCQDALNAAVASADEGVGPD